MAIVEVQDKDIIPFSPEEKKQRKIIEVADADIIPFKQFKPKQVTVTPPLESRYPRLFGAVSALGIPFVSKYMTEEGRRELTGDFFPTGTTTDPTKLREKERELETGEQRISPYESLAGETQEAINWYAVPKLLGVAGRLAREGAKLTKPTERVAQFLEKERHIIPPKVAKVPAPPMPTSFSREWVPKLTLGAKFTRDEARQLTKWMYDNPNDPLVKALKSWPHPLTDTQFDALKKQLTKMPLPPPKTGAKLKETKGEVELLPEGEVPKPRAKEGKKGPAAKAVDEFHKVAAPGARGELARFTSLAIRDYAAQYNLAALRINRLLRNARNSLTKASPEERMAFTDAVETGERLADPVLNEAKNTLHELHSGAVNELTSAGKGKIAEWYDNYFPHFFKKPEHARTVLQDMRTSPAARLGARPTTLHSRAMRGGEAKYPLLSDGIKAGLKPMYDNPIDAVLHGYKETTKYLTKIKVLNELKAAGFSQKNLPEEVVRIFNNYLSPGLHVHPAFRGFRNLGNLQVAIQLGLSGFHAGFTTADVFNSYLSAATYELARGNFSGAGRYLAESLFSPVSNVIRGHKLYMNALDPAKYPQVAPILEAITRGGGRPRMDAWYRINAVNKMMDGMRRGGIIGTLQTIYNAPAAAVESSMYPILEWLVPRQKLGLMSRLLEEEIKRKPNMTIGEMRNISAKISDSVDNRLGQLVYDNLMWNRTFKDLMLIVWRSVGWNLGTWREFGGGVVDTVRFFRNLLTKNKTPEFTHRMGYMVTLPVVVGTAGALTQYLATGKLPTQLRDLYFPQIDKEGNRISFPTYMKDLTTLSLRFPSSIYSMASHKLHPTLTTIADMLRNRDFYNVEIMHTGDPLDQQVKDAFSYFTQGILTPISLTSMKKMRERGEKGLIQYAPQIGILPAPVSVGRTPAENLASELVGKLAPPRTRTQASRLDALRSLEHRHRGGEDVLGEAHDLFLNGVINKKELQSFAKQPIDILVLDVGKLRLPDARNVYRVASPAEKAKLAPIIARKELSHKKQYPYEQKVEEQKVEGGEF